MIDVENVSLRYPSGAYALDCVSFKIGEGSSCAVLGANGAGKSTLLWAIMGLLNLSNGEIFLDKVKVAKSNAEKIRKTASLVFQNSDDQLFFPTVLEDVMFGILNRGIEKSQALQDAQSLLAELGIEHLKDRQNQYLSDGEKKKVAICSALACAPKILILDEPSALLDPRSRRETIELLNGLNKTILLTTHDLDFAQKSCEFSAVLKSGKLAAFGKTCDILANDKLLFDCRLA